jgi:hypothetical protein
MQSGDTGTRGDNDMVILDAVRNEPLYDEAA